MLIFKLFLINIKLALKGQRVRIRFNSDLNLFYADEGEQKHYFGDLQRGSTLYKKGLLKRGNKLAKTYMLDFISFNKEDTVIDCGANYADIWLYLHGKINPRNYITFEPGVIEHSAINLNAPNGLHKNLGLSNHSGSSIFYVNEHDADSSLIEPSKYSHKIEIKVITLSEFIRSNNLQRIKLLKLEAEGWEPEIIDGALDVLSRIEYIALDGGPERGTSEEETFSRINNILLNKGFELIGTNFNYGRALFINKNVIV
jgi:FkbM family methyltransferase